MSLKSPVLGCRDAHLAENSFQTRSNTDEVLPSALPVKPEKSLYFFQCGVIQPCGGNPASDQLRHIHQGQHTANYRGKPCK